MFDNIIGEIRFHWDNIRYGKIQQYILVGSSRHAEMMQETRRNLSEEFGDVPISITYADNIGLGDNLDNGPDVTINTDEEVVLLGVRRNIVSHLVSARVGVEVADV